MRLVKRNMYHTGYFFMNDGRLIPSFTQDLIFEGKQRPDSKEIVAVFKTNEDNISSLLFKINHFKTKYGIIPQNYVSELRTGFNQSGSLTQYHNTFLYR